MRRRRGGVSKPPTPRLVGSKVIQPDTGHIYYARHGVDPPAPDAMLFGIVEIAGDDL